MVLWEYTVNKFARGRDGVTVFKKASMSKCLLSSVLKCKSYIE